MRSGADSASARDREPVAIVTGGSWAAGRDVARLLARRGYAVVLVYLDGQGTVEAVIDEILAARGTALAVRADVSSRLDVERLFSETLVAFEGVDAIVHTTTAPPAVLYGDAARHLRRAAAIVSVVRGEQLAPDLVRELRERDITLNGVAPGTEPPGADRDVPGLLAALDRWRAARSGTARPAGDDGPGGLGLPRDGRHP